MANANIQGWSFPGCPDEPNNSLLRGRNLTRYYRTGFSVEKDAEVE
jgi:hypothetical protein